MAVWSLAKQTAIPNCLPILWALSKRNAWIINWFIANFSSVIKIPLFCVIRTERKSVNFTSRVMKSTQTLLIGLDHIAKWKKSTGIAVHKYSLDFYRMYILQCKSFHMLPLSVRVPHVKKKQLSPADSSSQFCKMGDLEMQNPWHCAKHSSVSPVSPLLLIRLTSV